MCRDASDDVSTGEVLVGTSTGTICKASVIDGKDKYWKEIYSLQDSAQPIVRNVSQFRSANTENESEFRKSVLSGDRESSLSCTNRHH